MRGSTLVFMQDTTRAKLRRLYTAPAIIGWFFVFKPIVQLLTQIADLDFYISAAGNPRMVAVWNFFATPSGNIILIVLGVVWIAYLVARPDNSIPVVNDSVGGADKHQPQLKEGVIQGRASQPEIVEREVAPDPKLEPNFVCKGTYVVRAHQERGMLVLGHESNPYQPLNVFAIVAEICNEFDASRRVGDTRGVSAEVLYRRADGRTLDVKRGIWLSAASYKRSFRVNDIHSLIVAVHLEDSDPPVFVFIREPGESYEDIENRISFLEGELYQVKVRLITESESVLHKEFDFTLTVTREPEFSIELIEGAQDERTKRLTLARRLNELAKEGDALLLYAAGKGAEPAVGVAEWEQKAETFIGLNLGEMRAIGFSSEAGVKSYPGAAVDRRLVDRLHTRLQRIGQIIEEL